MKEIQKEVTPMNSLFSTRHYRAIAEVLAENRPVVDREKYATWQGICDDLADLFEADNPRDGKGHGFRRDKWEEDCLR